MRKAHLFVMIVALSLLSGCQTLSEGLREPDIKLSNVQLGDISGTRQTIVLDFVVTNPNDIPLPIRAIGYGVSLGGTSLVSGKTEDAFRIPANGDGTFSVSVETSLADIVRMVGSRLLTGGETSLDYEARGDVEIDLPFVKPLPFVSAGTINIQR
ncbi:MAG: LEA type 2 family protein [Pseudomonadota bacterium]